MSEAINGKRVFSLLDVNKSIQKTLRQRYGSAVWVKAEMMKLNHYPHSGHCYPDLVEKRDGRIVAEMRANLWRSDFRRINANFEKVLKEPLKDDIKILFLAKINFDPKYGLSLQILDIDPAFTLGDMEQERQKTIAQLKEDHLFNKNKALPLPLLPKRIAIISVETSKGLADFRKIIDQNEFGYRFFYFLFPSLLQGDDAVSSIIRALRRIQKVQSHFDIVAIIRGGGGDIGLSCYNNYELCAAIAHFPLPVISGIGHATNETVVELIAHENCITPTKMAEWLLQHFQQFALPLQKGKETIVQQSRMILKEKRNQFQTQIKYFKSATKNHLSFNQNTLFHIRKSLFSQTYFQLKQARTQLFQQQEKCIKNAHNYGTREKEKLKHLQQQIKLVDPVKVLQRGYSITYMDGKVVKNVNQVKENTELDTRLADGKMKSLVTNIEKN